MTVQASIFDQQIDVWRREQELPWYRIMRRQMQTNLASHLAAGALRVLDAGGGNGRDSLQLAAAGHQVLLVDYSAAMLADAEAKAAALGLQEQMQVQQAELSGIDELLKGETFDAVLCHNVIQYLDDAPALLRQLAAALRPGGLLSLVSMNRYSAVYAALLLRNDVKAARAGIGAHAAHTVIFDAPLIVYSAAEAAAMLAQAGLAVTADYGLLCITAYWREDERKHDPAVYAQLEELELALMDQEPYKSLARSFQVIAHKR